MTTQTSTRPRTYGIPVFDKGVAHGISWHLPGDEEYRLPSAAHIVDFIKGNFLEPHDEGYLDLERLTDNAGFLVGWILGEFEGIFRGRLPVEPSEEGIVEIIQNLVDFALEGNLTDEQLRQDTGIVVGFVLSHPHLF